MQWTLVKEMNGMDYGLNETDEREYDLKKVRLSMIIEFNNVT